MSQSLFTMRLRAFLSAISLCLAWQAVGWLPGGPAIASAQQPTIMRIEEDWELVVSSPDPNSIAPQVSCAFSPTGSVDSVYATFELNHQSQPEFVAGGLQLQTWNDNTPLVSQKLAPSGVFTQSNETVRWTQVMSLELGVLSFEIVNGTSTTWGDFSGQSSVQASGDLSLLDLNGYSPEISVENSGIGFASNRVESLVLKRVRRVTALGVVLEDNNPRVVHTHN